MTKLLQELPVVQDVPLSGDPFMLIKFAQGVADPLDHQILVSDFLKTRIPTTKIGLAVGNIFELVNVGGNPGLPAIDGSNLTNLDIPVGSNLEQGLLNLSDSTSSSQGVGGGVAATPFAVKTVNDAKFAKIGGNITGQVTFTTGATVTLENDVAYRGKKVGGNAVELIKVNSLDNIEVGENADRTVIVGSPVGIYHYGSEKFKTAVDGADITGNLRVSGNLQTHGTQTSGLYVTGSVCRFLGNDLLTTASSGIDADSLNGISAANYLRGDVTDTFTSLQSTTGSISLGSYGIAPPDSIGCSNWFRSSGATGWYNSTYGGGISMSDTIWIRTSHNKSFHSSGEIRAIGNITAYFSDERLKKNFKPIEGALDSVISWEPVTYEHNELAKSVGFKDKGREVGFKASQIKATTPEAVAIAPFDQDEHGNSVSGENYLTVDYERLVPVLVGAIQELEARVKELEG